MNGPNYTAVHDVMTPDPLTIDGLAHVSQAIEIMRAEKVSSLVIEKRHDGDEWGLLTVHHIAAAVVGRDRSPDRASVYEVMAKPVLTVDAEMDIKYAVRLLARFKLSRALVTEKGALVGIVTLRDMVLR